MLLSNSLPSSPRRPTGLPSPVAAFIVICVAGLDSSGFDWKRPESILAVPTGYSCPSLRRPSAFRSLYLAYSTQTWQSYSEPEALELQPSRRIPQQLRTPPYTPTFEAIVAMIFQAAVSFDDLSVSGVVGPSLENRLALAVADIDIVLHLSKRWRG